MANIPPALLGLLPSLEVLPFFTESPSGALFPFRPRPYSSYGEISRNLLTRKLVGGIIPWEIFITDMLALPGQRTCWKIPIFLNACPTELVLREAVYKAFYPSQKSNADRLPQRLTVGVESRNSLTKAQSHEWLSRWKNGNRVEVTFKMLPIDMMIHALKAEALDAIIAPSPWGIHAEATGLGKRDLSFSPGTYAQRLVLVCHQDFLQDRIDMSQQLARSVSEARTLLENPSVLSDSIMRMSRFGKPLIRSDVLETAADLHSFVSLNKDFVPDIPTLLTELMALDDFDVLPSQVAACEQTARLLHTA